MRRRIACFFLVSALAAGASRADDSLSEARLNSLKRATAYIKVEKDGASVTGSGFLIRVDGPTGYVVTNHHVVALVRHVTRVEYKYIPFGRGRPLRLPVVRDEGVPVENPSVSVVFFSGTRDEQSVPGEVVGSDTTVDLAVVKVGPVAGLPAPIDLSRTAELRETRPVFALGYPFGQFLATGKRGPAVTVTKGTITSLRRDDRDEVDRVQIDSDVNPGNSGGPVVDPDGRLVGIAVAKLMDTRIGFAIVPRKLDSMLEGRVGPAELTQSDARQIDARVPLVDPFNRIGSLVLYHAPASAAKDRPGTESIESLKESHKVVLKRDGQSATASFSIEAPDGTEYALVYELAWTDARRRTHRGERQRFVADIPSRAGKVVTDSPPEPETAPVPGGKSAPANNLKDLPPVEPRPAGKALSDAEITRVLPQLAEPATLQQAAQTLGRANVDGRRRAEVVRSLRQAISVKDLPAGARGDVLRALGVWGNEEDVEVVIPFAVDGNADVRAEATETLGWLGGGRAAEAVADRIENAAEKDRVVRCLHRIGPAAEGAVVSLVLGSERAGVRLDGCKLLKAIGTERSLQILDTMARDDGSEAVRRAALSAAVAIRARQNTAGK
jgi:hypothetical protein